MRACGRALCTPRMHAIQAHRSIRHAYATDDPQREAEWWKGGKRASHLLPRGHFIEGRSCLLLQLSDLAFIAFAHSDGLFVVSSHWDSSGLLPSFTHPRAPELSTHGTTAVVLSLSVPRSGFACCVRRPLRQGLEKEERVRSVPLVPRRRSGRARGTELETARREL